MYDEVWFLLNVLLECFRGTLDVNDAGAVRTFIAPAGAPPWDTCCHVGNREGQAWIQLQLVTPTNNFPSATGPQRLGFGEWAVSVNIGVLRCASTVDDNGRAPSVESMMAEAEKVSRDRTLIYQTLECCFIPELDDEGGYLIGAWTPLGPQGGCVGGQQQFTFAAPVCGCPPVADPDPEGFGLSPFGTAPLSS